MVHKYEFEAEPRDANSTRKNHREVNRPLGRVFLPHAPHSRERPTHICDFESRSARLHQFVWRVLPEHVYIRMTGTNDRRFSISEQIKLLDNAAANKVRRRLAALDARLRACSPFQLRDDSRLAMIAATGGAPPFWTDDVVVHEMCAAQWIWCKTEYAQLIQKVMREVANGIRARYNIKDWSVIWRIVTAYVPDIVRYLCIQRTPYGQIPDFYGQGSMDGEARSAPLETVSSRGNTQTG